MNDSDLPGATNPALPPGAARTTVLRGHEAPIEALAWSSDGRTVASASRDGVLGVWPGPTGPGHLSQTPQLASLAFGSSDRLIASVGTDGAVRLTDVAKGVVTSVIAYEQSCVAFARNGRLVTARSTGAIETWSRVGMRHLGTESPPVRLERVGGVSSVALSATGTLLAIGADYGEIEIWNIDYTRPAIFRRLDGHRGAVLALAFDPNLRVVATGGTDRTLCLWDVGSGKMLRQIEGHFAPIEQVLFLAGGELVASRDASGQIRVTDAHSGQPLAVVEREGNWFPAIAATPSKTALAVAVHGQWPGAYAGNIEIWDLNKWTLLDRSPASSVSYASAKIVLLGESGVGKTGLGWRLAHDEFREHASTHGQQFWTLDQLSRERHDGALCEAILWDLAGQPDYRLIHALFVDDADVALIVFDPTRDDDTLRGVEYWLEQIRGGPRGVLANGPDVVLVAGRADRGAGRITERDLAAFCREHRIRTHVSTSALENTGLDALTNELHAILDWDSRPATVTSTAFKAVKDLVADLKQSRAATELMSRTEVLRSQLEARRHDLELSEDEMDTALVHLSNHGYVTALKTSSGEARILLSPELLNNVAASIVLEARRNPKGLGSLEEGAVLSNAYAFRELDGLAPNEQEILLDSAVSMFIDHNICFRETDPLSTRAYLVFPDLINLKRPIRWDRDGVEAGPSYLMRGAVQNVYASLVVLLGYSNTFVRSNQWGDRAEYVVGDGLICGFQLHPLGEGELGFSTYFDEAVPRPHRRLFEALFESFLVRRDLVTTRYERAQCVNGHEISIADIRLRLEEAATDVYCVRCGDRVALVGIEGSHRSGASPPGVESERVAVSARGRFEHALFRLKAHVTQSRLATPSCFISYAWGKREHEQWVEQKLAPDLANAGIEVILDQWENARIGASVPRFVERVATADTIVVVGTRLYREKYENRLSMGGAVLAAEGDLIGAKMLQTEDAKQSVLPILRDGGPEEALPPLLQGRVYADLREGDAYFEEMLDLILSIHGLEIHGDVGMTLRAILRGDPKGLESGA